jgi:MoaA/NifB/PqqE/SkfB family radical SAM enzyme
MTKLEDIRKKLESCTAIEIVDVIDTDFKPKGWNHWVEFLVAPKKPAYDAKKLQKILAGVVPDLKPTIKDDFKQYGGRLEFGKLYFDEEIEDEDLESLIEKLPEDKREKVREEVSNNGKEKYKRRTFVKLYPDRWIAEASKKERWDAPEHSVRLKDIKTFKPGYRLSLFKRFREFGKRVDKKIASFLQPFFLQKADNASRKRWRRYVENPGFLLYTVTTTNRCTLRCQHCFEEAGPDRNDFLDADRVEQLAEESIEVFQRYPRSEIRITGGDPLLHPKIYDIIKSFSSRRDKMGYSCLDVETNGWWATDDEIARETLLRLKEAGAALVSMTFDSFHHENSPFDNNAHFNRLVKIAREIDEKETDFRFRYIAVGFPNLIMENGKKVMRSEIVPIGRGRQLDEKYWGDHMTCKARGCRLSGLFLMGIIGEYSHTDEVTFGPTGNVYICNSGKEFEHASLALGNINEQTLPEILENKNPLVETIRNEGLRGITKRLGMSVWQHWRMYEKFSPCGMCHELLREYGKEISAAL